MEHCQDPPFEECDSIFARAHRTPVIYRVTMEDGRVFVIDSMRETAVAGFVHLVSAKARITKGLRYSFITSSDNVVHSGEGIDVSFRSIASVEQAQKIYPE